MRNHLRELFRALRARRDLRAQIGEVLLDARREASRRENSGHLLAKEAPLRDQLHVVEQHALFVDMAAVRRHRVRGDAADVGMMAARGDEELGIPVVPVQTGTRCLSLNVAEPRLRGGDDSRNTGAITVTSGRCVPPLYGAFSTNTSPARIVPRRRSMMVATLSPIEPRCTGMCGAFAIRLPSASNSAQEKSRRSLMFTE